MVECGHQKLSGLNFNLLFLLLKMKNSITTDDRCRINLWAEHGGCGATDRCNCRDQVRGFPVKTKCDLNLLSKRETLINKFAGWFNVKIYSTLLKILKTY